MELLRVHLGQLQIIAIVSPVFIGWGLEGSIYGLVLLSGIRFLWLLTVLSDYSRIDFDLQLLKKYCFISIPLILYALLSGFPAMFDNWLVGWYFSDKEVFAIFRYGYKELPIAVALATGLSNAMIPEVVENKVLAIKKIKARSKRLFHYIFPLTILMMLTSKWWFPVVFNNEFTESASIFNILLLIVVSRLLFPQTILIALKDSKTILEESIFCCSL